MFEIYKRGQGKYVRICTYAGGMLIAVVGALSLSLKLAGYELTNTPFVKYGVPTAVVAGIAVLLFWLVNRPKTADFFIATEGEMKKVSWSSRKEIIGSTKVVIITTLIMAALLFGVDMLFTLFFQTIGVMYK
jgi:preprotein translocase subunit SecE